MMFQNDQNAPNNPEYLSRPLYCPNPSCNKFVETEKILSQPSFEHAFETTPGTQPWFASRGSITRKDLTKVRRFSCKTCLKCFTLSIFSIDYRFQKRGDLNKVIFEGLVHNRSNRSISRMLGVSEGLIRIRLKRFFQIGILKHFQNLNKIQITEDIAFDGLEAFARSQYEPNNVNQSVGANSLFGYLFNYAPMNRKGRMSPRQKEYLQNLEIEEGRFDPKAIRKTSLEIFKELIKMKSPDLEKLTLKTDEHFQYRRAIQKDLTVEERKSVFHQTVSSKACRNYKNILFGVNHLDLVIRRKSAAFARETICFAKKASRMMHKYGLFLFYKNYFKPKFVKKSKVDPTHNTHSPAMALGLYDHLLSFDEYFAIRLPVKNYKFLPLDWNLLCNDQVAYHRER